MSSLPRPVVKICCIASMVEARIAIEAGAHALGLVSAMPSGPGVIDEDLIAEIAASVVPSTRTFLLTAHCRADEIIAQHRRCRTTTLQLVDHVPHAELMRLRDALPSVELVQVIHVQGEQSITEAMAVAPLVDAILLDSGNQMLDVKELGGTGRTHDLRISRRIRDAISKPLFLAGGLRPDNVREAAFAVLPFGLDVCSGLRTDGKLDPQKVEDFFDKLKHW